MKTTREMMAVMQASEDGKRIEFRVMTDADAEWLPIKPPVAWDWSSYDYRIETVSLGEALVLLKKGKLQHHLIVEGFNSMSPYPTLFEKKDIDKVGLAIKQAITNTQLHDFEVLKRTTSLQNALTLLEIELSNDLVIHPDNGEVYIVRKSRLEQIRKDIQSHIGGGALLSQPPMYNAFHFKPATDGKYLAANLDGSMYWVASYEDGWMSVEAVFFWAPLPPLT